MARIELASKKQADAATREKELAVAKRQWKNPRHDLVLSGTTKAPGWLPDMIQAAVKWECFRHLYFSGRLSQFWCDLIHYDRFTAWEKHFPGKFGPVSFFSAEPGGFAAPWNTWTDAPSFPVLSWADAMKQPDFNHVVQCSPRPTAPVALLMDHVGSWSKLWDWSLSQIEGGEDLSPCEIKTRMQTPLEIPSFKGTTSVVAIEIDWSATKERIKEAFLSQIDSLWAERNPIKMTEKNPKKRTGRRDGDTTFFKGLVLLRRMSRGICEYDACEGMYTPRKDRKDALPPAARAALENAHTAFEETLNTLAVVEATIQRE